MWRLADDKNISAAHVQAKIEACLAQGISTIDQADIYGGYKAEEIFGAALKQAPHLRDKIEIVTKCDIVAPVGRHQKAKVNIMIPAPNISTNLLKTAFAFMAIEQIDLLLIHRPDPFMNHYETGAALDTLISSGKVQAVGVSNFKLQDWTLQSAMRHKLVTNQIEISVLANQAFINGDIAFLQEKTIALMAWSPLAGGALFSAGHEKLVSVLKKLADAQGVDISAAIAWLLAHPARIMPVLGTNNLTHVLLKYQMQPK